MKWEKLTMMKHLPEVSESRATRLSPWPTSRSRSRELRSVAEKLRALSTSWRERHAELTSTTSMAASVSSAVSALRQAGS